MLRKKPEGEQLEFWCREWDLADHDKKIELAKESGITYGTAKHWRSESSDIPKATETPRPMTISTEELLSLRPSTQLDFVFFDLETSNLKADFSVLLTACIKPFGQPPIVFRGDDYSTWASNRSDDSGITVDIAKELSKHAIVVTHYGDRFDIPYLRAKMVHHDIEPLPPMFGIDTWKIARNNFQISSRRLKNLATYFDIGEKEGVEGALWMEAAYDGDREAMDRIVLHNIRDCEVLEKLGCLSFKYCRSIPKL